MADRGPADERRRALYVIPRAQRRGAEVDATLLAAELASEYQPLVLTLYGGADPAVLGGRVPVLPGGARSGGVRRLLGVSPAAIRHVRRAIASFRPDVVVAYGGEPLLHAIPAAGRHGPPVLYVKISMASRKLMRGFRRQAFRRAAAHAAVVTAVAPHLARELVEDLGVERKVFVTPTFRVAADVPDRSQRARVRRELGVPDDAFLAAFVGNLSHEKGPDVAVEALAHADRRVQLVVVGQGPMAEELRARAARPGIAGRVRLLGPRADVPRLLAAADSVVLSSREEGRPGVLLEAALAGLPTVATHVGGVPDLVRDGVEGLVVPPEDPAALGAMLTGLANDRPLAERLGRAARDRSEAYLAPAVLPRWREAFEAAIASR